MNKKNKYLNNTFINIYSFIQKGLNMKKIKSIMYYIDRVLMLFIRKPKYQSDKKKKVAIIFNLALGDGIIFLNALNDIHKKYPKDKYTITLICQKGLEKIYEKSNTIDNIIPINFTKSTINLKERLASLKKICSNYYDIVLDPIGTNECFTNVLMTRNTYAKEKIGCIIDEYPKICPKHILKKTYSEIKSIKTKALIEQYYEFFYEEYTVKYCKLPKEKCSLDLPKEYYLVFPSASMELKRWPAERYAEIIKRIYQKTKLPLVFCGTSVDRAAYQELKEYIPNIPIIDIIDKTTLLSFIDVVDRAKFVITNDTSTYHIAVICETPVAIITGGYTYDRYVTYEFKGSDKYKKPYVIVNKMNCFNCSNNCSKISKGEKLWPCLDKVTIDYAWKIIEKMIDKEK